MAYKIKFQELATEDLKNVRKFLEKFPDANPSRTLREIRDEIRKLKDWHGHRRFDENPILHKLTVGKYNILYLVDEKQKAVLIEYIFHQSRDIKKVLDREEPTLGYDEPEPDFEIDDEEEELEF